MTKPVSLPVLKNNARPDLCGPCGGKCCKGMPGAFMPSDFGYDAVMIRAGLESALREGKAVVDWWEGEFDDGSQNPEYIRAPIKGHEGRVRHGGWGGECSLLTASGCSLSFEQRPSQCRALEPSSDGSCEMPTPFMGKEPYILAWAPYRELIDEAVDAAMASKRAA